MEGNWSPSDASCQYENTFQLHLQGNKMCLSLWTSRKRMMILAGRVQENFLLMKFAWQLLRDVIYQICQR